MPITHYQSNFSGGEIDPRIKGRSDIQQYQNGLSQAWNVFIQPQGGVRRRDGLRFIRDMHSANYDKFQMLNFRSNDGLDYLLVFTHRALAIFRDDQFIDSMTTPFDEDVIGKLSDASTPAGMIIASGEIEPQLLTRNSDTDWELKGLWLSNLTGFPFFGGILQALASIVFPRLLPLTAASTEDGSQEITLNSTTGRVTITGASAFDYNVPTLAQESSYGLHALELRGGGRIWLDPAETTDTTLTGVFDADATRTSYDSSEWKFVDYEEQWSNAKGWPRVVDYYEQRVFFGGSETYPGTVWGSAIGDIRIFRAIKGLDSDAVEGTLAADVTPHITHIKSAADLQIMTNSGTFIVERGITPSSFFVNRHTSNGAKSNMPIVDLNGNSVFINDAGKALFSLRYHRDANAYSTTPISLLSTHLIDDPTDLAIRRSTSADEADRIFLVNDDYSVTVYSILESQNVVAASQMHTPGNFRCVAVSDAQVYFIVERKINGVWRPFLERLDPELTLDSAVSFTGSTQKTLSHLDGREISIVGNNTVLDPQTGPTITGLDADSDHQAGIFFNCAFRTLPVEPNLAQGTIRRLKKRIVQVDILLDRTQTLSVNGYAVPFRSLNEDLLNAGIEEFTGIKTINGLLGFSMDGVLEFRQTAPLKMNVLSVEYQISVGN